VSSPPSTPSASSASARRWTSSAGATASSSSSISRSVSTIQKLLSGDPEKQIQAVKTLAATGEIEVIPWLLPFLEAENKDLRIWTGSSLEKLVSSHVLKRRDMNMPEFVVIKSLRPGDRDLRPLAWVVLKMFRKPDDGNTHAYAASMAGYLGLHEFERELEQCLKSRHPAVSNKAKWALESLGLYQEYEKATSNRLDTGISKLKTSVNISKELSKSIRLDANSPAYSLLQTLRDEVEKVLKMEGYVGVVPAVWKDDPEKRLEIYIDGLPIPEKQSYVYSVEVHLREKVSLMNISGKNAGSAIIWWGKSDLKTASIDDFSEKVISDAKYYVEALIADFADHIAEQER